MPDPCGSASLGPETQGNSGISDRPIITIPAGTIGLIMTIHVAPNTLGGWDILANYYVTNSAGTGFQTHLTPEISVVATRNGDTTITMEVPVSLSAQRLHEVWKTNPVNPAFPSSATNTVTYNVDFYCIDVPRAFFDLTPIGWLEFTPPAVRGFSRGQVIGYHHIPKIRHRRPVPCGNY